MPFPRCKFRLPFGPAAREELQVAVRASSRRATSRACEPAAHGPLASPLTRLAVGGNLREIVAIAERPTEIDDRATATVKTIDHRQDRQVGDRRTTASD